MEAIFLTGGGSAAVERAYDEETRRRLARELDFVPAAPESRAFLTTGIGRNVRCIFSTWGMPALSEAEIRTSFPNLKAVFYAAGTVQDFARPFLSCGVRVFSAWAANAVPVAEFVSAQIVLAAKGYYQTAERYKAEGWEPARRYVSGFPGFYGISVGILGAGMVGKRVIRLLQGRDVKIMVYDPFLPQKEADALGVTLCGLETVFRDCQVVSNHLANNAQTKHMLNYPLFRLMRPNATFINTGRGAQVVEEDLVRALNDEPGRTALIDVTAVEPASESHPFRRQRNVWITPHIAGSMNNEVARMGRLMYEEFRRLRDGEKVRYEVTRDMLKTMA